MRLVSSLLAVVLGLLMYSDRCMADYWRLPDGRIVQTSENSTPPFAGARRLQVYTPSKQRSSSSSETIQPNGQQQSLQYQTQANQSQHEQQSVGNSVVLFGSSGNNSAAKQQNQSPDWCSTQPQVQPQQNQNKPVQIVNPCSKYYGRGYCTDYIQQRVGYKPKGNAGTWPGNTPISSIRAGDVAIFSGGSDGHVAYVEDVIADKATGNPLQIRISEMNAGRLLPDSESQQCSITTEFGKIRTNTIPISKVAKVWRP